MKFMNRYLSALILLTPFCLDITFANEQPLIGLWQKIGEVEFLEIKEHEGRVSGKIIRADWQPQLEGKTVFYISSYNPSMSRWDAIVVDERGDERSGKIRLSKGSLVITSKGRKRTNWVKASLDDW